MFLINQKFFTFLFFFKVKGVGDPWMVPQLFREKKLGRKNPRPPNPARAFFQGAGS